MATLIQGANAVAGNAQATVITLPAAPTPGHLLVLHTWARDGASFGMPVGFTVEATRAVAPFLQIASRVAQSGDAAAWTSGDAAGRRLYLAEWQGLGRPSAFVTGSLVNTLPTAVPVGADFALGIYAVTTDDVLSVGHVIAPSTIDYEADQGGGFGPFGSVGHKAFELDLQATQNAIDFAPQAYLIGNYPGSAGGGTFAGEPGGGVW